LLTVWQGQVGEALRAARTSLEKGATALAAAKKDRPEVAAAGEFLAKARKDYEVVVKAKGIHNPDLAEAIFTESKMSAEWAIGLLIK
ncbi:MAG: hypothetical protein ACHQ7N_22125, partial [Candidatus Methylomirabilales bacterium]